MSLRVFSVAAVCAAVVAGALYFFMARPVPVTERAATPAPTSTVPAPSTPEPAPVVPAPASAPRPERRAAAPAAAPAAEPAPEAAAPAAAPTVGVLRIDSDVPGAQVFIDRELVGRTPVTANVAPGSHRLNVSAEGVEGYAGTIDVEPGPRDVTIKLREVKLDLALQVVHKHRIGSCSGRLLATPAGVRYETSNKDDAFTTGLNNLEKLEVDYLQKTLRVKVRGGKQYDFADPEGNADRLFVFHRDVDKARQRLAKGDSPGE